MGAKLYWRYLDCVIRIVLCARWERPSPTCAQQELAISAHAWIPDILWRKKVNLCFLPSFSHSPSCSVKILRRGEFIATVATYMDDGRCLKGHDTKQINNKVSLWAEFITHILTADYSDQQRTLTFCCATVYNVVCQWYMYFDESMSLITAGVQYNHREFGHVQWTSSGDKFQWRLRRRKVCLCAILERENTPSLMFVFFVIRLVKCFTTYGWQAFLKVYFGMVYLRVLHVLLAKSLIHVPGGACLPLSNSIHVSQRRYFAGPVV